MRTWAPGICDMPLARAGRGFTLVEILVALVILGVFSVLSYQGLARMLDGSAALKSSLLSLEQLDNALLWLEEACGKALYIRLPPAPPDERYRGDAQPPGLVAEIWRPVADPSQAPQRLLLSLQQNRLSVVIASLGRQEPNQTAIPLLDGVRQIGVQVWDAHAQPRSVWPSGAATELPPRAVEWRLTLEDGRVYRRLFALR